MIAHQRDTEAQSFAAQEAAREVPLRGSGMAGSPRARRVSSPTWPGGAPVVVTSRRRPALFAIAEMQPAAFSGAPFHRGERHGAASAPGRFRPGRRFPVMAGACQGPLQRPAYSQPPRGTAERTKASSRPRTDRGRRRTGTRSLMAVKDAAAAISRARGIA